MKKVAILASCFTAILGIMTQPGIAQNQRSSLRVYLVRANLCNVYIVNVQSKEPMPLHEFLLARKGISWRVSSHGRSISTTSLSAYYNEHCTQQRTLGRDEILDFTPPRPLEGNYNILLREGSQVALSCSEKPQGNVDSIDDELTPVSAWIRNNRCSN